MSLQFYPQLPFLTPSVQPQTFPQKTPAYPTYSLDQPVIQGGKSSGAGAGDRPVHRQVISTTSQTAPRDKEENRRDLAYFQGIWERQWNRQSEPLGPLVLFSDAALSRSEGEAGHSPSRPLNPGGRPLDVPTVTTKDIRKAIRESDTKPRVKYYPIPLPDGGGGRNRRPEDCRDQWVPVQNREIKGTFIPVQNRRFKTIYFRNTCNETEIQVRYPISPGERAISKIRSIVRSKANIKRPKQLRNDHRCKCGNNSNFDDSCRCTNRPKDTRGNGKTHSSIPQNGPIKPYSRRKTRSTSLPRQVRTHHPEHNSNRRFLGHHRAAYKKHSRHSQKYPWL